MTNDALIVVMDPIVLRPQRIKMTYSSSKVPDRASVQRVAASTLQTKSVSVERLEGVLFRTFRLVPAADYFYVLRCQPSCHIRLLRHEQERLHTEAIALRTLRGRADLQLPRLIDYHTSTTPIGSAYLISGPFKGSILVDIEPSLSTQALASIDRSLGQYVRHLHRATHTSFGPVREATLPGHSSWSRCFASMLETVLRDGEDALISLPYDYIRDLVRRRRSCLDQITQPRLTLLEMVSDQNIIVDTNTMTVAGLLDWSTTMWGDPYMSDCFCRPSVSFAEGFGKLPNRTPDERIRQYLYILYHSVLAIVRHCCRPSEDGDELNARRTMTAALGQLSK
ncbi:unnamed protein product [Zymoseptoria tritici ST99CH_1A5]|uniref:Aminoglycoside phosphotransferase domain-containing protein n=4 Tax=Zymoseptoria tritici TaxID=1047171 RepID=A0A1X7S6C3_ZYMT9|nr:unnamed protein product [Zymoseptoria tritici ST99CH_3D7]SMR60458.1 unnamed protein product [Zymoseptoria tritici ST99CH_1E4]SMR63568.1 unnamed protein product [Zymoseptoria tritici ST99CH_3D1]SMY28934.1 unnamed protein product [Zymoseptoria tritici ST99CH_1A5]